ncbi:TetR/AcrR family transcriptional regulator C-terminal domain-containing protein [Roseburia hominis]
MLKIDIKGVLADSLKELLKENPYESISVQDISKYSDISRTTFYNHFRDKYDLVSWIYKTESDQICKGFTNSQWREFHSKVLEYMRKERNYYINISSYQGQNCIQDYIVNYTLACMVHRLKRELGVEELPENVETSLYMWNLSRTAVVFRWICSKDSRSPKEITRLVCDCIPEPISQYYQ